MSVDTALWRVRIGTFSQPRKVKSRLKTLRVAWKSVSLAMRLFLCMSLLVCGDIEANPGPKNTGSASRSTRQTSLYFPSNDGKQRSGSDSGAIDEPQGQGEVLAFLKDMKQELAAQNVQVREDLSAINSKIDSMTGTINELKTENEQLRLSNEKLKEEMLSLNAKIDTLEAHSRRNNLRINGIDGTHDESWETSEEKVRDFIGTELGMPEMTDVEIKRAHRLKSGSGKTIIVKFSKYKDTQQILQRATSTLKNTDFSVQPDCTDRVKRHRRELGREMIAARQDNKYASIRYDKLIVEDKMYRYDDKTSAVVCIGDRRRNQRAGRSPSVHDSTSGVQVGDQSIHTSTGDDGAK